jgi:hypothetical protein
MEAFSLQLTQRRDAQHEVLCEVLASITDIVGLVMDYLMDYHVAVGDDHGGLHFCDLEFDLDPSPLTSVHPIERAISAIDANEQYLAFGSVGGLISIWTLHDMRCVWRLQHKQYQPVHRIHFLTSTRLVASFKNGYSPIDTSVHVFELSATTVKKKSLLRRHLIACTKTKFVCSGQNKTTVVYDAETLQSFEDPKDKDAFREVYQGWFIDDATLVFEPAHKWVDCGYLLFDLDANEERTRLPLSFDHLYEGTILMHTSNNEQVLAVPTALGVNLVTVASATHYHERFVRSVTLPCSLQDEAGLMQLADDTLAVLDQVSGTNEAAYAFSIMLVDIQTMETNDLYFHYPEKPQQWREMRCMTKLRIPYTPPVKRASRKRKREEEESKRLFTDDDPDESVWWVCACHKRTAGSKCGSCIRWRTHFEQRDERRLKTARESLERKRARSHYLGTEGTWFQF